MKMNFQKSGGALRLGFTSALLGGALLVTGGRANAQIALGSGQTYTQDFNALGTSATATLPTGFKVDKNTTARTVGKFSAAGTATERAGGANLGTTAGNGIYNFGSGTTSTGDAIDRAVGFLAASTGTASGNVYAQFTNNTGAPVTSLNIAFDAEKYRNGTNTAGFRVEAFYSADDATYTTTGLKGVFPGGDASNAGFATAPGATANVSGTFTPGAPIAVGATFYLAFNYSVSTGTTTASAQALAVDNVSLTPVNGTISQVPTATSSSVSTAFNTPVNITLAGTDPQGQTLTYNIVSGPKNGTLSGTGANQTYTPTTGFVGADSFTFTVTDTDGNTSPAATETIAVNEVPSATVTTTQDVVNATDNLTSFAEAITFANANAGTTIKFNIPKTDTRFNGSYFTLPFTTAPGPINAAGTVVDGTTQTGFSGDTNTAGPEIYFNGSGVTTASSGLFIRSNGFAVRGLAINNFGAGNTVINAQTNAAIAVANNTTAGSTLVTSGLIENCYLGTDPTGAQSGNGNLFGVRLQGGVTSTVGGVSGITVRSNVIAFNKIDGVRVEANATGASTGDKITQNSIHDNGGLGINLQPTGEAASTVTANDGGDGDTGPNNLQNFPVITSASGKTITGTLNSTASSTFTVEFFSNTAADASGYGEGQTYLGSTTVTTGADGNVSFSFTSTTALGTGFISATAISSTGDTSEFSAVSQATVPPATPSSALISEFRLSGPTGTADEFIEIYNNTNAPLDMTNWTLRVSDTVIPLSGIIPDRGHLLVTGAAYSLTGYAAGDVSVPTGVDLPLGANLTLLDPSGVAVDAVGGLTPANSASQYSFVRHFESGVPADTNSDASDFNLVDIGTAQTNSDASGVAGLDTNGRLGAPGPQSIASQSPIQRNNRITYANLSSSPTVKYPTTGGTLDPNGQLSLRRTITNNKGGTATKLRFRIAAITAGTSATTSAADLRALSSAALTVNGIPVQGLMLESPSAPTSGASGGNGGGLNSSWIATLPNGGLAVGQSINVQFLFGIVKGGSYRVVIDTELVQ